MYYWPGKTSDASRWCQTCVLCQRRKPGQGLDKSPLKRDLVYRTVQCVAVYSMGPFHIIDRGNHYIIVVGDYLTKWTEAQTLHDHRYRLSLTICMCINMPIWLVVKNPYRSRARIRVKSLIFKRMYVRQRPSIPKSEGMIERFKRTLQQRRRPER